VELTQLQKCAGVLEMSKRRSWKIFYLSKAANSVLQGSKATSSSITQEVGVRKNNLV